MAAPKPQLASFAVQISRQNLAPVSSILGRSFSQSIMRAEEASSPADAGSEFVETVRKGHTVFVGNMSYDATETHLHEAFSKYGDILSITIPRDGRGSAKG